MKSLPPIVLSDSSSRKALACVRSLGRHGIPIIVISSSYLDPARYSRYTAAVADHEILDTTRSNTYSEFEMSESIKLFLEEPEILEHYRKYEEVAPPYGYCLPPLSSFNIAINKHETFLFASQLGIPTIPSFLVQDIKDLRMAQLPNWLITEPLVTKPLNLNGSQGVRYYRDIANLLSSSWQIERDCGLFGSLLIQKRIDSSYKTIGVSLLFDLNGKCINGFVHMRLEQFPNSGGPSTKRISIVSDLLMGESIRLLTELKWSGLAMVEWFYNPISEDYHLVEINPRPWGSISLAILCGQNFPVRYYFAAQGRELEPCFDYSVGLINRWLLPGDILRWVTQKKSLKLKRVKGFRKVIQQSEEWDNKDLKPFIACIIQVLCMPFQPKNVKLLLSKLQGF